MTPSEQMAPERQAVDHTVQTEPQPPPAAPAEAAASRRRGLRVLGAVAAVVLMALAVAVGVKAFIGDDTGKGGVLEVTGPASFRLNFPEHWEPLPSRELEALPGRPLAVLSREDGEGVVVVRGEGRAPRNFDTFSRDLTRALDKRVPDFQRRSSRTIRVGAGNAFFYSYIRRRKGTVHTVVLVPAGKRSYALNTISPGGAQDVAREIARIILSFDT